MKAIQFREFGPPSVLKYVDIELPNATPTHMLLKVLAAGVNPIDAKIRDGSSFVSKQLKLPSGLGYDVCGEVITPIEGFKKGDIVFGSVGRHDHPCAYAEYCLAKSNEVIVKPQNLGMIEAAALPIVGLTAWQALHKHGEVRPGQRVLIHAAAGGVGHVAVQFAKAAGAYVIATASARNYNFLKDLRADHIIDYAVEDFSKSLKNIDLVIDLLGGEVGIKSLDVLQPKGKLVTVPTITRDQILEKAHGKKIQATGMLAVTALSDLKQIANLVAAKKVKIQIAATFPLADAAKAHVMLEEKHTQGKIVLQPKEGVCGENPGS